MAQQTSGSNHDRDDAVRGTPTAVRVSMAGDCADTARAMFATVLLHS